MRPFLRGARWWARIPMPGRKAGRQRWIGVEGTDRRAEALEVCGFLMALKRTATTDQGRAFLLEELEAGRCKVYPAYRAFVRADLDRFITELRQGVDDPDLEPLVARWQKELERRKKPGAETRRLYLGQVRTLIPEGRPFRRSELTRQRVRAWLAGLTVGQPNRYRAALSSFCGFLLLEELIPSNPVSLVPMAAEAAPRTLHLSPADVDRLIPAIEPKYRALHALMVSTAMEVSAALKLRRRDVVDRVAIDGTWTVQARGTKSAWRDRACVVYERWLPLFDRHVMTQLAGLLPDAPVFPGLTDEGALRALRAALEATRLPAEYRQHDHRHTWAVQAIRDGLALQTVAFQLGHRDVVMTLRVYGRFRPNADDFARSTATKSATPNLKENVK